MDLKYLLGQIQTDGGNLLHGTAPFHVVVATTTLWHSDAAIAGPFHTSKKPGQVSLEISFTCDTNPRGRSFRHKAVKWSLAKELAFFTSGIDPNQHRSRRM
jgi:hypothetical protein